MFSLLNCQGWLMYTKKRTIARNISFTGTGLHTGENCTITFRPAGPDHGIKFQRSDIADSKPMPADIDHVISIDRGTTIGIGEVKVHTVEHVLAALTGLGIDNILIELSGPEPPVGDGSAKPFVDILLDAGITEFDEEKKRILEKIYENSQEASGIIDDLMRFAKPPEARATRTEVRQILEEAIELAKQKTNTEQIDVQLEVAEDIRSVFVDSAQIASAIANIISNSVESYGAACGSVQITVATAESGDFIRVQISDNGCGMDSETVKNAILPFFSKKVAGRKRGMGLAYAMRFIQLNQASLQITSKAGSGTTVAIFFPCQ